MAGCRIEITLPKELYEEVETAASKRIMTKSKFIAEILEEYFEKNTTSKEVEK